MTTFVSQATSTARELVAGMLGAYPMYAALHTSEPMPNDPLSTIVRTSGNPAVRVLWKQDGVVLKNAIPVTFAGIDTNSTIAWLAICSDLRGTGVLFTAEFADPEPASIGNGVVTIPIDALQLIVA
jgi:hypothetical protein